MKQKSEGSDVQARYCPVWEKSVEVMAVRRELRQYITEGLGGRRKRWKCTYVRSRCRTS